MRCSHTNRSQASTNTKHCQTTSPWWLQYQSSHCDKPLITDPPKRSYSDAHPADMQHTSPSKVIDDQKPSRLPYPASARMDNDPCPLGNTPTGCQVLWCHRSLTTARSRVCQRKNMHRDKTQTGPAAQTMKTGSDPT